MNRKVILSTTICESSLTIPGIKTVIGRAMKTGHSFLAWFNIYSKIAKKYISRSNLPLMIVRLDYNQELLFKPRA